MRTTFNTFDLEGVRWIKGYDFPASTSPVKIGVKVFRSDLEKTFLGVKLRVCES